MLLTLQAQISEMQISHIPLVRPIHFLPDQQYTVAIRHAILHILIHFSVYYV